MTALSEKVLKAAYKAARKAQQENQQAGIPNVYSINGKIVWQLPDGTVTMQDPDKSDDVKTTAKN